MGNVVSPDAGALSRRSLLGGLLVGASLNCAAQTSAAPRPSIEVVRVGTPIDVTHIAPGTWLEYRLEGRPIFVRRLSPEQIAAVNKGVSSRKGMARRVTAGEWVVIYGVCTHAGCSVVATSGRGDAFACYCHGSQFDPLGRVRRGPAAEDLAVVPHAFREGKLVVLSALPYGLPK